MIINNSLVCVCNHPEEAILMEKIRQDMNMNNCHDNYKRLCDIGNSLPTMTDDEIARNSPDVASLLLVAIKSVNTASVKDLLRTMGNCIRDVRFCMSLSTEKCSEIVYELCNLMVNSAEKIVCIRATWCLAVQNFDSVLLNQMATLILARLCDSFTKLSPSTNAHYESLKVIETLLRRVPDKMETLAPVWWKIVFSSVVHPDVKVRKLAKDVLDAGRNHLQNNTKVIQRIAVEMKERLVRKMLLLFESDELGVIELWVALVDTLGDNLHRGTSLVNCLIEVVGKAGSSRSESSRLLILNAWRRFIDIFATNLDVLTNVKRLRFLLKPLEAINLWTTEGVENRIVVWWHLVVSIKTQLEMHLAMVVEPLLKHCFDQYIGTSDSNPSVSRARPRLPNDVRLMLVDFGTQILLLLFEEAPEEGMYGADFGCKLEPLQNAALSSSVAFCSHSEWLLASLVAASVENVMSRRQLLLHVWRRAAIHLKNVSEDASRRHLAIKLTAVFLQSVRHVVTTIADVALTMEMLELTVSVASLPKSILLSSAVSLDSQDLLEGTPCIFLLEVLLEEYVLKHGSWKKLSAVFLKLVSFADVTKEVAVLDIIKSIIGRLEAALQHTENAKGAFKLWRHVANELHSYIIRTKDINQGGNSEHDFTCILATLLFPIDHFLCYTLHHKLRKPLIATWSQLYETFTMAASLVSNCDANTCCAEIVAWIIPAVQRMTMSNNNYVENVLTLISILTKHLRWNDVTIVSRDMTTVHRSQLMTIESAAACNLTPLITLLSLLLDGFVKGAMGFNSGVVAVKLFVDQLSLLFDNLRGAAFIDALVLLTPAISQMLIFSIPEDQTFSNGKLMQHLDSLWSKVAKAIPAQHVGNYDTKLLGHLSSLFEATINHKRTSIRINCRQLWKTTFASNYDKLVIPATLSAHPFFTKDLRRLKICVRDGETVDDDELEPEVNNVIGERTTDERSVANKCVDKQKRRVKLVTISRTTFHRMSSSDTVKDFETPNERNDICRAYAAVNSPQELRFFIDQLNVEVEPTGMTSDDTDSNEHEMDVSTSIDRLNNAMHDEGMRLDEVADECCRQDDRIECVTGGSGTEDVEELVFLDGVDKDVFMIVKNVLEKLEADEVHRERHSGVSMSFTRGILKRTRTADETESAELLSMSPPTVKQRRVTFTSPPVTSARILTPPPPKRRYKRKTLSTDKQTNDNDSVIDDKVPICAELVNSTESLYTVLHQISTSMRTRGLSRILASRNIFTIGHLSALSEADVITLPIKTPKVKMAKKALYSYLHSILKKEEQLPPQEEQPDGFDISMNSPDSNPPVLDTAIVSVPSSLHADENQSSAPSTPPSSPFDEDVATQTNELAMNASASDIFNDVERYAGYLVSRGITHLSPDEITGVFQRIMVPVLVAWNSAATSTARNQH